MVNPVRAFFTFDSLSASHGADPLSLDYSTGFIPIKFTGGTREVI
jgi:hypothetical protein